jgi:hypothetical protein
MRAMGVALALALLVGCDVDLDGRNRCTRSDECNEGRVCTAGRCQAPADAAAQEESPDAGDPDRAAADQASLDLDLDGGADGDLDTGGDRAIDIADAENDGGRDADAITDAAPPSLEPSPRGEPSELPVFYTFLLSAEGRLWLEANVLGSRLPGETFSRDLTNLSQTIPGGIGLIDDVEAQGVGLEMNVIVRTAGGLSVARRREQVWSPWELIAPRGRAMGLANLEGQLVACVVGSDGSLRLGTRTPSGAWTAFVDVTDDASLPASSGARPAGFKKVDCAGIGPALEVIVVDGAGRLWHATKMPSAWIRFHAIENIGDRSFTEVSVSNSVGALHVLATTPDTQYHIARSGTGGWTQLVDLENLDVGRVDPGGRILSGSEGGTFSTVWFAQITSAGDLWIGARLSDIYFPFWQEELATTPAGPFMGVALALGLP